MGSQSPENLLSLYKHADVFALVSLYEGFGLPLLEAMANGIPFVYSNNSSLPEIAGETGIPVDAFDEESIAEGIYKLIDNRQLAELLAKKGIRRAAQFTWEKTARETLEVYKEIAG